MSNIDMRGARVSSSMIGDGSTSIVINRTSSASFGDSETMDLKEIQNELEKIKKSLRCDLKHVEELEKCAKKGSAERLKKLANEISKGIAAGTIGNLLAALLEKILGM